MTRALGDEGIAEDEIRSYDTDGELMRRARACLQVQPGNKDRHVPCASRTFTRCEAYNLRVRDGGWQKEVGPLMLAGDNVVTLEEFIKFFGYKK
jgi:hypothetical protein